MSLLVALVSRGCVRKTMNVPPHNFEGKIES